MSFVVDKVRDFRVNGKLSDDSTISQFWCDDSACERKVFAEHDESLLPDGWFALKNKNTVLHACSMECRIRVLAWISTGDTGRSTD